MKTCSYCKTKFQPFRPLQKACSPMCALEIGRIATAKKQVIETIQDRKQTKARKEAIKTNGEHKASAQQAINAYVRARDADLPCISCGRMHEGAWHAGHYRTRGAAPHLALDERNLHRQCAPCNLHLHGNLIAYRAGLIVRHGLAFVEAIEADHTPRHYTAADYQSIKTTYAQKLRALKESRE